MDSKQILSRRMARFRSVQALFQMEASGDGMEKVLRDFESELISDCEPSEKMAEADKEYFRLLVETALDEQKKIDKLTNRVLKLDWSITRIDPTLRALFRAAGSEFVLRSAPPRVIISEFVEIAKAFYPEGKSAGFVNGVLDHMIKILNSEQSQKNKEKDSQKNIS